MTIIAKQPDLKVSWNTFSALTAYNANDLVSTKYFPSFSVYIYDNELLLDSLENLDNKREKIKIMSTKPLSKNLTRGVNLARKLERKKNQKKVIENYFEYSFLDNFLKYKDLNNKPGFYSNLKFRVKFNSEEPSYLDFDIEYPNLETINLDSIFYKVYRSNDLYSTKFLIDPIKFKELAIHSLLIFPKAIDTNLSYSFIENVELNWLNSINNLKLLTAPFEDVGLIEQIKNINLEIFPLSKLQSDIVKQLQGLVNQEEMYLLIKEKYFSQRLEYSISSKINDTFFQGNFYLFNNLNFPSLSWPKEYKNINGVLYKNFFPVSNILTEKTVLGFGTETPKDEVLASITDIDLGFYYNENYINIENDILYFSHNNIISAEILNVEHVNDEVEIYIEFLTNLDPTENVFVSSDKLSLDKKYSKLYNNNLYLTLLFSYKYSLKELNAIGTEKNIPIKDIIYKQIPFEIQIKSV